MRVNETTIPPDVLQVFSEAEVSDGSVKLVGQLERKLYIQTNEALERLGGKWNRKAGCHTFPEGEDVSGLLQEAIESGKVPPKNALAYFATPDSIACDLVQGAIGKGGGVAGRWLEPSAGEGAILRAMLTSGVPPENISAVELDAKRCKAVRTYLRQIEQMDFMTWQSDGEFDYVAMNPPFAVPGSRTAWVDHVEKAWSLLAPGGVIAAILPSSFEFRNGKIATLREELLTHGECQKLPSGAFGESGTQVNAVMVIARKPGIRKENPMSDVTEAAAANALLGEERMAPAVEELFMTPEEMDEAFSALEERAESAPIVHRTTAHTAEKYPHSETIPLPLIDSANTQMRANGLDKPTVEDYREVIRTALDEAEAEAELSGHGLLEELEHPFPEIVLFHDSVSYYIGDGWHRVEAYRCEGVPVINAKLYKGGINEARLFACGANAKGALRRTPADKRKAVVEAIKLTTQPDGTTPSDRQIADLCRVSHTFVASVRQALRNAQGYQHPQDGDSTGNVASRIGGSDPFAADRQADDDAFEGKDPLNKPPQSDKQSDKRKGKSGKTYTIKQKRPDDQLTDADWLKTLPVHRHLKGKKLAAEGFDADALAWRSMAQSETLGQFQTRIGRTFDLSLGAHTPLEKLVHAVAKLPHPKEWNICPNCQGKGCADCGNAGYQLDFGKKPGKD